MVVASRYIIIDRECRLKFNRSNVYFNAFLYTYIYGVLLNSCLALLILTNMYFFLLWYPQEKRGGIAAKKKRSSSPIWHSVIKMSVP